MSVNWPRAFVAGVTLIGLYAGYRMVTAKPALPPAPVPHGPHESTQHLSNGFMKQVSDAAAAWRLRGARVTGEDLLMALYGESKVKPWPGNEWGYAGLNGMGEEQRKALGFQGSMADWQKLSAEQQMPYVRRFLEGNVRDFAAGDYSVLSDVGRLYLLNIMPALIRKPDDHVVFPRGSTVYARNAVIDTDKKGYVNVGDMAKYMHWTVTTDPGYWQELRERLRAVEVVA